MDNLSQKLLTKTRAEEHDVDIWGKFYIPPYFDRLNIFDSSKSTYFIGKRGCGKTMLLKYLSYHSRFSSKRNDIPVKEIEHVGIYWRIDTHFCNSMINRGKSESDWINIFQNYFSLVISTEICKSLYHLSKSPYKYFNYEDYLNIDLPSLADFGLGIPTNLNDLEKYLVGKYRGFSTWISNIEVIEPQAYPPGLDFIITLINALKQNYSLQDINFYIYLDEIENLLSYQRRFMNTVLKHSQKPFIVNFTSKVFIDENMTTGVESINATHDYSLKDLDLLMKEEERRIFFSEVFINNFAIDTRKTDFSYLDLVTNRERISERTTNEYKNDILGIMRTKFPSQTQKELAFETLNIPRIKNRIEESITLLIKDSGIFLEQFKGENYSVEAYIILPFILARKNNEPKVILDEYIKYSNQDNSKFNDWVHNNLFGALLELYRPYSDKKCPLYSGFDTFYTMANGNLRHFLILCAKALEINEMFECDPDIFSIDIQSQAAYESSNALIKEIRTLGKYGERLRIFTLRLGGIFKALQENPLLSEPEQNQFTINSGSRSFNDEELDFISEAQKHSILIEVTETKVKNSIGQDIRDFLLNPIYAPYFNISYRKKRKIEISVEDFSSLIMGTESQFKELHTRLTKPKRTALPIQSEQLGFFND